MQLYINDEIIDFSIEGEELLEELIDNLNNEFQKSNGRIISITADDTVVSLSETAWKSIPLASINNLYIEADTQEIAHIKVLQSILEYLQLIEDCVLQGIYPEGLDLEDINQILENIDSLCIAKTTEYTPLKILLSYIFEKILLFKNVGPLQAHEDMELIFTHIRHIIVFRTLVLLDSSKKWENLNTHIARFIDESYLKVIHFFVNAKEHIAIQYIISANDILLEWLHILHHIPHYFSHEEDKEKWHTMNHKIHKDIQPFLEEQHAAIEVEDWISAGDLIEYEIAPKLLQYIEDLEVFKDIKEN